MKESTNYLRVWDNITCGNSYAQFYKDCQAKGYTSIIVFPAYGEPRISIAAENEEILENSLIYKEMKKIYFT